MHGTCQRLALFLSLSLGACASGPYYTFTTTGPKAAARAKGCEFEIITTVPQKRYRELGVLEPGLRPGGIGGGSTSRLAAFKEAVRESVCQAGADAVVTLINSDGRYVKATAIKYTSAPASMPASRPSR